jgi:hypothetical protein
MQPEVVATKEALPWTSWAGISARLTPRVLFSTLITLILVVGEWQYHVLGGYERLVYCLGGCMLIELALSYYVLGRAPRLLSSYISGNSLSLLSKPVAGLVWPFLAGSFLAIGSKYVLRWRGSHLWNPTNFAVTALLLLAPREYAILSHEWGNGLFTIAIIWSIGMAVVRRAKILHVTLAYLGAFFPLAALRASMGSVPFTTAIWAEIGPITGPMYQLFIFFMITDPATVVSSRTWRIRVAVMIAIVEAFIRFGNDHGIDFAASYPAMIALAIVGPIAKAIDQELIWRRKTRA